MTTADKTITSLETLCINTVRILAADAVQHARAGLELYDEERCAHHRHIYAGHDPAICALLTTATARWMLGYPDQSVRFGDESLRLARKLRHAPSLVHSPHMCAIR